MLATFTSNAIKLLLQARIGVSGGPGIGKTTLAKQLAAWFCTPLITEGVREWLTVRSLPAPHTLDRCSQVAIQRHFLRRKMLLEASQTTFISDRTVFDGIVITEQRLGCEGKRLLAEEFCRSFAHARCNYDIVVIPPFRIWPEVDHLRNPDVKFRRCEHEAIVSVVREVNVPLIQLQSHNFVTQVVEIAIALGKHRCPC